MATREELKKKIAAAGGKTDFGNATALVLEQTTEGMIKQGKQFGIQTDPAPNADLRGLHWLVTYGIKGVAAYAYHAYRLGKKDDKVFEFIEQGLASALDQSLGVNDFVGLALKCGEINIRAMELLDAGNTETYGHPVPTKVPLGAKKGKAILVSGHDLKDLDELLKQTEGKGITVYTHGEMLPAHGYPKLKQYPHFYGHYGTAWQNQQREFAAFPGAILMTTNCIQKPAETYKGQHLHFRTSQLARSNPHRRRRLLTSNQQSFSYARLHRRHRRQNRHGRIRKQRRPRSSRRCN